MAALQAQVLYDYEAQDGDQLTIQAGEIIDIIDDSPDLNGWALARRGDKEGYVPAEYVRYVDQTPYFTEEWPSTGFQNYYASSALSQEHQMGFSAKLSHGLKSVFLPQSCTRFTYTMSRADLKRGAILHLVFSFLIALIDVLAMIAPIMPFGQGTPSIAQVVLVVSTIGLRMAVCLWFIARFPRPDLQLCTFPLANVLAALTYSIRVYESLEMGDSKEYDGYRFYRSWMWASAINVPFTVAAVVLISVGQPGLVAVSVVVLVLNLLNVGRCFLAQWASVAAGNDIHPDFETTIKQYKL